MSLDTNTIGKLIGIQTWVLHWIRANPGHGLEDIARAYMKLDANSESGDDGEDDAPAGTIPIIVKALKSAKFIRCQHGDGEDHAYVQVDPEPAPRTDVRAIYVETGNSKFETHTKESPEFLAGLLEDDSHHEVVTFVNPDGSPHSIVRTGSIDVIALGELLVKTDLQ